MSEQNAGRRDTPLITVLTLSYRSPDLHAAIRSALEQDYARIQYILVDDGTEGFSEGDISEYIEARRNANVEEFLIIRNPENLGTVRAANIGLQHARGEFIFNLAGDDVFADPKVLSDWTDAFQRSGALVMTAYRDVYDENMEHYLGRMPTASQVKRIRRLPPAELFEETAKTNHAFGCCTARSRQCLELYGNYDERYRLVEDHPMILRLLRQGAPLIFFDRVVVRYRNNGASSPSRYNEDYERDVDMIFQNEVLPYTNRPARMTRAHNKWKKKQQSAKRLYAKLQDPGVGAFRAARLKIRFYLHYPIDSFKGLIANPVKLKRLFRKT